MTKWPPVLTIIAGFALAFIIAASLLVAPCGPGCAWPAFAVTLLYSTSVLFLRFKQQTSRYTALLLAIISLALLAHQLYTRQVFRKMVHERALQVQSRIISERQPTNGNRTSGGTERR